MPFACATLFNTGHDRLRLWRRFVECMREYPLLVIGFALWFAYIALVYQSVEMFSSIRLGAYMLPGCIGALFFVALSLVVMVFVYKKKRFVLGGRLYFVAIVAAQVCGAALCIGWRVCGSENFLVGLTCWVGASVVLGVSSAFVYLEFNRIMGWLGMVRTLFVSTVATLAGSVIVLVLTSLPTALFYGAFVALPVAMMVPLVATLRRNGLARDYFSHGSTTPIPVPWRFLITSLAEGLASGLILGGLVATGGVDSSFPVVFAGHVVTTVLLIVVTFMLQLDFNRLIYQGAFPLIALGFIVLGCGWFGVAGRVIQTVGHCFLDLLLWGLGSYLIRDADLPAEWITAGPSGALFSGLVAGALVGTFFTQGLSRDSLTVLLLISASALLLVALLLSSSSNFEHGWGAIKPGGENAGQPQIVEACCLYLADEHGLTPRESETLLLLVRGLPRKMIASELFVSESTVKSHVRSIHRKLMVRTQAELMELLRSTENMIRPES